MKFFEFFWIQLLTPPGFPEAEQALPVNPSILIHPVPAKTFQDALGHTKTFSWVVPHVLVLLTVRGRQEEGRIIIHQRYFARLF